MVTDQGEYRDCAAKHVFVREGSIDSTIGGLQSHLWQRICYSIPRNIVDAMELGSDSRDCGSWELG